MKWNKRRKYSDGTSRHRDLANGGKMYASGSGDKTYSDEHYGAILPLNGNATISVTNEVGDNLTEIELLVGVYFRINATAVTIHAGSADTYIYFDE